MTDNNIFKMVIVLFIICCLSGLSLSYLYVKTAPKIQLNKIEKEIKIKKQIMPKSENFSTKSISNNLVIEECYSKDNKVIGLLLKDISKGYAGDIEYLVGIDISTPPKISGIKIISHKETPGLGANVAKEKFLFQFIGKTANELTLKKENPDGLIDAITGATITSRAITNSLKKLLSDDAINKYVNETMQSIYIKENKPVVIKKTNITPKKVENIEPSYQQLQPQIIPQHQEGQ
ncbi:MAG: RnfABCDGE type electron transport complex subunit G [Endomicrobia bacterium]|nr:RnfABCDGE type electron transport complex subunit G [Endomicrobiia bacterium]